MDGSAQYKKKMYAGMPICVHALKPIQHRRREKGGYTCDIGGNVLVHAVCVLPQSGKGDDQLVQIEHLCAEGDSEGR